MTACLSLHYHYVLWHFWLDISRNKNFWMKKWPTYFGVLVFFYIFLCLSFFFFSNLLAAVIPFYWAYFQFKNFWEGIIKTATFYPGIGTWSRRQFCSEFFTQISEHFRGYFRLHWADLSDHGITGKNFSFCRTWVQMMPILINDYDVWRETKALSELLSHFM